MAPTEKPQREDRANYRFARDIRDIQIKLQWIRKNDGESPSTTYKAHLHSTTWLFGQRRGRYDVNDVDDIPAIVFAG